MIRPDVLRFTTGRMVAALNAYSIQIRDGLTPALKQVIAAFDAFGRTMAGQRNPFVQPGEEA